MTTLSRPIIGSLFSMIAIAFVAGLAPPGNAAMWPGHKAIADTDIARTGFLDLKTFLIVPLGDDGEIGLASEQMRIISPETLFAKQPRLDLLKSIRGKGAFGDYGEPIVPARAADDDGMTIKVNGQPFTMSLGLEEAILSDMETNIRTYGDPGLFTGVGFASASYLGAMTKDVLEKIGRLENIANGDFAGDPAASSAANQIFVSGPVYVIPAPPTLGVFVAGLFMIGWLRRRRDRGQRGAI